MRKAPCRLLSFCKSDPIAKPSGRGSVPAARFAVVGQRGRCPSRVAKSCAKLLADGEAKFCAKLLAGCIVFCDSDSCAKHKGLWERLNPARKLLAGCIAFCDSDSCAKLLADGVVKSCAKLFAYGWLNSCAKLRKQISRNHCPTRHTRPTRPTSPSAKREALSPYAASTIGLAVHFQLALRMRMPFSVVIPLR